MCGRALCRCVHWLHVHFRGVHVCVCLHFRGVHMCVCVHFADVCMYVHFTGMYVCVHLTGVCVCAFVCTFHRCMRVCTCAFQRCVHVHTQSSVVEGSTSSMLPPLPSSLVVTSLCSSSQLSQSAGDLNSGPHACIAGTGPTEPTPQLCTANLRSLWSLQCRSCS